MSQTTTCRACGASLAPDQRYCLSCGTRVSSPRLDFLAEHGQAEGVAEQPPTLAATPATTAAGGHSRLDRIGGPMGAAAVVLVALGIGFLIGQNGNNDAPVAQKAPVVNIQGGLPASAATTAAPTTTTSDAAASGGGTNDGASSSDAGSSSSGTRSSSSSSSSSSDAASAADARRVEDSTRDIPKTDTSTAGGDLNRLRAQPSETATEGAPPRTDNKAPGGGSTERAFTIG